MLASKILASAYFAQGYHVQSFPFFGMERKGAAVAAFVRVAKRPIVERGEVRNPSMVVVLDSTLLQMVDITKGVESGGAILLDAAVQDAGLLPGGSFRIATVDARSIALEYGLGNKIAPIVNTVILGAFAKVADNLDLEHLLAAIKASVPFNPEQNAAAARAAYAKVRWIDGQQAASLGIPTQSDAAIQSLSEIPTLPETRGFIDWNQTGNWRYLTPVAANKLPPCRSNCPAGMSIPEILQAACKGQNLEALERVLSVNPLPGLTSRLCYHPCQTDCLRKIVDRPVAIQQIERFMAAQNCSPSTPKLPNPIARVVVVGAGPIGLTIGYFLGRSGCQVTILASETRPGGALTRLAHQKLDQEVLKTEIARLVRLSHVEFRLGVSIDRTSVNELHSSFDLVILDPVERANDPQVQEIASNSFKTAESENHKIILPDLPPGLLPFKHSLIACYVAAGRRIAREAHAYLAGRNGSSLKVPFSGGSEDSTAPLKPLSPAEMRIERFTADRSSSHKSTARGMVMDGEQAHSEARRCLSCGTCNLCEQCISNCPDVSIHRGRTAIEVSFDLQHCKGCGICAHVCPRAVISMEKITS